MWVARSVRKSPIQAVLYAYGSTRSGTFAQDLYRGFRGTFQCDGYSGYNKFGRLGHSNWLFRPCSAEVL
ncbi:hypothetical protein EFS30_13995 [Levilactobacillus parabrevis]|nr:IS66 family transposase [Levilactobacillus parabrevis]MCT4489006.1 hypothetical protein [Levilactobacillus parabrevis]MCT4491673.1 hypothetical protein [Levilactobacillus parabrevis]